MPDLAIVPRLDSRSFLVIPRRKSEEKVKLCVRVVCGVHVCSGVKVV